MLTLPAPDATRTTASATSSLVVRLELPDLDHRASTGSATTSRPDPERSGPDRRDADRRDAERPGHERPDTQRLDAQRLDPQPVDLERLARAVEDLVRAVAPHVLTQVWIEEPVRRPRLHAAPEPGPEPTSEPASEPVSAPAVSAGAEPITVDLGSRTLSVDGEPVELTRREFDLLAYLTQRRAVALSRRELMNAVWQTGYLAGDRTIDVHVRRLRVKLGRHAERLTTLRGFGYRFD